MKTYGVFQKTEKGRMQYLPTLLYHERHPEAHRILSTGSCSDKLTAFAGSERE